jgi:hypothetical protein
MYIGALRRMNIIRVGCIALTAVALNMVLQSWSGEWRGRVCVRSWVCRGRSVTVKRHTRFEKLHGRNAEPLSRQSAIEPFALLSGSRPVANLTSPSSPPSPQPLPSTRTPQRPCNHRNHVRRGDRDQALQVRHWYAPHRPHTRRAMLTCRTAGTPPTELPRSSRPLPPRFAGPRHQLETLRGRCR